jgi:hypothetical protein
MNKNRLRLFAQLLLSLLQCLIILAVFLLEKFSSAKMGVARYLVYKKQVFQTTLFTPSLLNLYLLAFTLGAVACLMFMIGKVKRGESVVPLLVAMLANTSGVIFLLLKVDLAAYHFFLIGIMVITVIQYIKALIIK